MTAGVEGEINLNTKYRSGLKRFISLFTEMWMYVSVCSKRTCTCGVKIQLRTHGEGDRVSGELPLCAGGGKCGSTMHAKYPQMQDKGICL